MNPNLTHQRRHHIAAAAVLIALLLPIVAAAIDCPVSTLPRPTEDHATIRARLEAQGLWKTTDDPALTPPPDPQLGDTWMWYVWDLGGMPQANLKPATVRGLGANVYVVVDDDEWNVTMNQADVDRIVEHFDDISVGDFPDQGIWDLNTSHFGDPPNPLDGLDRIFLFYYRFDIAADGFFWVYDQFPDGSQPWASNECDVVYMATDSSQPASDYMMAVAAHEFEHLIHYARDTNESTWVDEGLAELAMWLFGHPDTISGFNSNPDNSLLEWGGAWADYIQTYLWTLYCYEQYGGQPFIWTWLTIRPIAWPVTRTPSTVSVTGLKPPTSSMTGLLPTTLTTSPCRTASTATRGTSCRRSWPGARGPSIRWTTSAACRSTPPTTCG